MALLDLPGSDQSGMGSALPISANQRRGPWVGANLLVVGPAGSGKLSLVRAVLQALDPRIRLSLIDFETEPLSQRALLDQLRATRIDQRPESSTELVEAIIFRHIHRLAPRRMTELISICGAIAGSSLKSPLRFHATSHSFTDYSRILKGELQSLFNCLIQWTGFPRTEAGIRQFVTDVIADLNRRYGQHIVGVDPPVVDLVQRISEHANLYEIRNVIERAYFHEESSNLSMQAVTAVCSPKEKVRPPRNSRNLVSRALVH